jgi:tRNA-Thr(GGU) m(6)t(6)A37 methyltransferase TsaA
MQGERRSGRPDPAVRRGTARRAGNRAAAATRLRLRPIGVIRSTLRTRAAAPRQGGEGAPDAWLEVWPSAARALRGVTVGARIVVITWLHRARRDVLQVRPRNDRRRRLTGVFATRSPDRPNPLGLHVVTVREIAGNRLRIGPIEAIDGTPVVDLKPVLKHEEGV